MRTLGLFTLAFSLFALVNCGKSPQDTANEANQRIQTVQQLKTELLRTYEIDVDDPNSQEQADSKGWGVYSRDDFKNIAGKLQAIVDNVNRLEDLSKQPGIEVAGLDSLLTDRSHAESYLNSLNGWEVAHR